MHEKKGKSPLAAKFPHKSHLMCMNILQGQAFSCRFLGIKGNGNPLRHADIINRRLLFKYARVIVRVCSSIRTGVMGVGIFWNNATPDCL